MTRRRLSPPLEAVGRRLSSLEGVSSALAGVVAVELEPSTGCGTCTCTGQLRLPDGRKVECHMCHGAGVR